MLFFAIKIKMPYSQRSENTARSYFYLSDMAKSILCSLCHPVKGLWHIPMRQIAARQIARAALTAPELVNFGKGLVSAGVMKIALTTRR